MGLLDLRSSPLPLRERVDRAQRETGEGFFSANTVLALTSQTPHPRLRGTFSRKGRREDGVRQNGHA
jgi:hypothetical protein